MLHLLHSFLAYLRLHLYTLNICIQIAPAEMNFNVGIYFCHIKPEKLCAFISDSNGKGGSNF